MLSSTGTPRVRASAKASSPHSHQSTGLSACWRRYGTRRAHQTVRHHWTPLSPVRPSSPLGESRRPAGSALWGHGRRGSNPVRAAGGVHRGRLHGRCRDLRAPGRRGRGGRLGGVDLVPPRRRCRRPAGLLLREARSAVPLGRRVPGVRRPGWGRGPLHRRPGVAAARGQRDHHRDGGGVLRQLCQRCCRRQRRLGQAVRRARPARDGEPERPRLPGRRQGPDGGRHRRHRHPLVFSVATLCNHGPRPAGVLGLPVVAGHRVQRGADLLRLPRLRRHHLHRQGPRGPQPPAPQGHLPGARHRHASCTSPWPSASSGR